MGKHKKPTKKDRESQKTVPARLTSFTGGNIGCDAAKIPIEVQQQLLDVFQNACSGIFDSQLPSTIQLVKQDLFNRDFAAAFRSDDHRDAYMARWSPTRALAYAHIFYNLPAVRDVFRPCMTSWKGGEKANDKDIGCSSEQLSHASSESIAEPKEFISSRLAERRIVCIGAGGGAELASLATFLKLILQHIEMPSAGADSDSREDEINVRMTVRCTSVDVADWSSNLDKLSTSLFNPPPLSAYASKDSVRANVPFVNPSFLTSKFLLQDALQDLDGALVEEVRSANLTTIFFTLNELYGSSMGSTTKFLLNLTTLIRPGALLLVIDSPGSYSTVHMGSSSKNATVNEKTSTDAMASKASPKQYPMHWMLDHTLLTKASEVVAKDLGSREAAAQWGKIETWEGKWFRLSPPLRYAISLEDMRYQLHLYQKLA